MKQTLKNRLRNPDEDFVAYLRMLVMVVPMGLAFVIVLGLVVIAIIAKIITEPVLLQTLHFWMRILGLASLPIILVSYLLLKYLYLYSSVKLKKKNRAGS